MNIDLGGSMTEVIIKKKPYCVDYDDKVVESSEKCVYCGESPSFVIEIEILTVTDSAGNYLDSKDPRFLDAKHKIEKMEKARTPICEKDECSGRADLDKLGKELFIETRPIRR